MEPRIFHGDLTPKSLALSLVGAYHRGALHAQALGRGNHYVVQVVTSPHAPSGGQTALSIDIRQVVDGVAVQVGKQAWLGVAASLGQTALAAWRNPWSLIGRLDDVAQDVENLQLIDSVWTTIEQAARAAGASFELSERLRRVMCSYCQTANPVGEPSCIACGAPLGEAQPRTCAKCGFVVRTGESRCPNCRAPLP